MTTEENHKLLNDYIQEIQKIYPTFKFGYAHGSETDGNIHSSQFEFLLNQKSLNGSDYDIGDQKEFIHYTSLEAFFEILNSQTIRLYDLNNLNDPFEFNAAIKELKMPFKNDEIEFFKRSLFVTSLCQYNETLRDNFEMWRLYGRNGNGIAIVFEILNPNDKWYNFLIAKIRYGFSSQAGTNLLKAVTLTEDYVKNKGMILDRIPQLLAMFLMFHKNEIWRIEKEYRLCTYHEYDRYIFADKHFLNPIAADSLNLSLNSAGKQTGYVKYPIETNFEKVCSKLFTDTDDFEKAVQTLPRLKIKNIIGGYALSDEMHDQLRSFTIRFGRQKLNSRIDYQPSHLTKWFR